MNLRIEKSLNIDSSSIVIEDENMTNENVKKIKQIIDYFIRSNEKEKEIEFREPLSVSRGETIELFGIAKDSILTTRFDWWIELLIYDNLKILIVYENVNNKIFKINKIKLTKN